MSLSCRLPAKKKIVPEEPGVVTHAFNPGIQESEAKGLLVQGHPETHSKLINQPTNWTN